MRTDDGFIWPLRYAAARLLIFPVNARGTPLVAHWKEDASSDPAAVEAWCSKRPHCEFGWALPADIVAVDLDEKNGKHGLRDFRDHAGCDPRTVLTPQATTPSGGLHLFHKASKPYKNAAPAIIGTGIDTRALGGYVVLPLPGNGREWLRPLIPADGVIAPLLPAPAWLDVALKQAPSPRAPLVLAPRSALVPPSSDSWAQKKALAALARACDRIVAAPCGAQDNTRHAQCHLIGGVIGRGDLGYEEAFIALLGAARAMPVYRDPWRDLESRVARSIESGIGRPLAISEDELLMRRFRARMRFKHPAAGVRHGQ
jgi:Bifunctional DNA primase/polymerase, N-terminal